MRKIFLLLILFTSVNLSAQEIAEDKVDEFTGSVLKRTSWETMSETMKLCIQVRISKVNEFYYFEAKAIIPPDEVFSVKEGDKLMFIFDDKSVFELENLSYSITSKGGGSTGFRGANQQGATMTYISNSDPSLSVLKTKTIQKIRFYNSLGYIDQEIKPKRATCIKNMANLIE